MWQVQRVQSPLRHLLIGTGYGVIKYWILFCSKEEEEEGAVPITARLATLTICRTEWLHLPQMNQ